MKRIYIAGAIRSTDPLQFLENIRRGMRLSAQAIMAGYAVYSPFVDFNFFLQLHPGERIPVEMIQAQSMAWLEVCDAVLVVPGWENSQGTAAEIAVAHVEGIPVVYSLEELSLTLPGDMISYER